MSKRILSFLLAIITVLSLIVIPTPIEVAYANDNANADGAGSGGGSKSGTWSSSVYGYRVYIVDQEGNRVSKIIDFISNEMNSKLSRVGIFFLGTKFDSILYTTSHAPNNSYYERYLIDDIKSTWKDGTDYWPKPIVYSGRAKGNGVAVREWLVSNAKSNYFGGKPSGGHGQINVDVDTVIPPSTSTGNSSNNSNNTKPTNPPSNATGGGANVGGGGNIGNITAGTARSNTVLKIGAQMRNTFNTYKNAGYSKSLALYYTDITANRLYGEAYTCGIWSESDLEVFKGTINSVRQSLENTPEWEYTIGDKNNSNYKGFNKGDHKNPDKNLNGPNKNPSMPNKRPSGPNKGKNPNHGKIEKKPGIIDQAIDIAGGIFSSNDVNYDEFTSLDYLEATPSTSSLLVSYASETAPDGTEYNSDEAFNRDLNLVRIISATINGKILFEPLSSSGIKLVNNDVYDTLMANNLTVCIEAIYCFRPARNLDSQYSGGWFYGTVTNYGQFGTSGLYNDGGKGGWYGNVINDTGAIALYIPRDLYEDNVFVSGVEPVEKVRPNSTIADTSLGYDLHAYYFSGQVPNYPSTHTYDYENYPYGDKNDPAEVSPHPAPDPDTVEKTPFETALEEAGEDTADQTRHIHIVKVYQYEDILGNINHVTTTYRDDNPNIIDIEHEAQYKVVEWFTSPFYAKDVDPKVDEKTEWEYFTGISEDAKVNFIVDVSSLNKELVMTQGNSGSSSGGDTGTANEVRLPLHEQFSKATAAINGAIAAIDGPGVSQGNTNEISEPETAWDNTKDKLHEEISKARQEVTNGLSAASSPTRFANEASEGSGSSSGADGHGLGFSKPGITEHKKYEWDEVKDKLPATVQDTVKLWLGCDCYDKEAGEDPTSGTHYWDNTLYVLLLRKDEPEPTHTWDYDNYPTGDPHPAPEPPEPPESPDPDLDISQLFPYDINIVKTYRTHDLTLGVTYHDGTYYREENPGTILIEDEPQYSLTEWFVSTDYVYQGYDTTWETITSSAPVTGQSGTSETEITVEKPNTTLYLLLEKEIQSPPVVPTNPLDEDLTESQLTKISTADNAYFGWSGYTFKADIAAAVTSHTYTLHVGCTGGPFCGCSGHCGDYTVTCGDVTRERGDHVISATFGMKDSWKDRHETSVANPGAHSDFDGKMYGQGGKVADEIKFEEPNLDDSAHSYTLNSNGQSKDGITYITTISRQSVGDKLNLALYKKNAMNATSYSRIETLHPGSNTPTGNRLPNGVLHETIGYTIGHIAFDNSTTSTCKGCGCPSHHTVFSDTKTVQYDKQEWPLIGYFDVYTYGGDKAKTANTRPSNMTGFFVSYTSSGMASDKSALFTVPQTATIKFYPYIKMSYMITQDNISFPGYTEPNAANGRTVYMLSDKQSTIIPTNSVEISWFNETQANGGYGLQMTSTQWSTHSRAVNGSDGWQGPNQVLPGGALYQLNTKDTESYIKTVTYNTLIDDESRTWITVSDPSKYTTQSIIKSTQDYLTEAKNVIENYRIVQWVSTEFGDTAWDSESNSVKIAGGGESLANLDLPGKASTDEKYLLINGTTSQGVDEADIDIQRESYQTTVFKGFSDVNGDIYVAAITMPTGVKMLDQATLDSIVDLLKPVCGTNLQGTISGLSSDMTYSIVKVGSKTETKQQILENIRTNSQYSYLYTIDSKTKWLSNLIDSVERNTGSDSRNATWTTDGHWYNEAYDGIYLVMQSATYQVGIGIPSLRSSVLDPNLCPSKGSTSQVFTNAHMSQFCLDSKSTVAQSEDNGYVGTFEGVKVYLPDLETMYYSRPFYIPNANVQDLT